MKTQLEASNPRLDAILEFYHDKYYLGQPMGTQVTRFTDLSINLRQLSYWLSDQGVMPYIEVQVGEDYLDGEDFIEVMKPWYPVDEEVFGSAPEFIGLLNEIFAGDDLKWIFENYMTYEPKDKTKLLIVGDRLYTRVPEEVIPYKWVDETAKVIRVYEVSEDEAVFRMLYPIVEGTGSDDQIDIYEERHTFVKDGRTWVAEAASLMDTYVWQEDMVPYHLSSDMVVVDRQTKTFIDRLEEIIEAGGNQEAFNIGLGDLCHILPDRANRVPRIDSGISTVELLICNGKDLPVDLMTGDTFEMIKQGDGEPEVCRVGGVMPDGFELNYEGTITLMENEDVLFEPSLYIHNFIATDKAGVYTLLAYDGQGNFHSAECVYKDSNGNINRVIYDSFGNKRVFLNVGPEDGYREVNRDEA